MTLLFEETLRLPAGAALFRGRLNRAAQREILDDVAGILRAAPPYRLKMRNGSYLINRMTNCGQLGWHSDARGYRYVERHPETGAPWPTIPSSVRRIAREISARCGVAGYEPDACLVNLYEDSGRLNLHQDHDECDFAWPIVSFSFGADAVFLLGGLKRRDRAGEILLRSGDVLVLHGPGRMRFHGVKKIVPGTAPFAHRAIPEGGRLNLTCRRAR